jgi:hypothetical protein
MAVNVVTRNVGQRNVPQDVRRRRYQVFDLMRRMGTPVLIKHMYNAEDVESGVAEPSPVFDSIYSQTRNEDPVSHGVGYVSVEKSTNEWIHPNTGAIVTNSTSPGAGYVKAPKYRGFGPGYLTYIIEPDVAEDVFKMTETGVLIKSQQAQAIAPWYPEINDNDLVVNVIVGQNAMTIKETKERYQAKMTNPISIRGLDRRGRREYTEDGGNRHVVNQTFEMTLVPSNNVLYNVETDR